jgi:hypothetical protein
MLLTAVLLVLDFFFQIMLDVYDNLLLVTNVYICLLL